MSPAARRLMGFPGSNTVDGAHGSCAEVPRLMQHKRPYPYVKPPNGIEFTGPL
jgi:hypothetical protein